MRSRLRRLERLAEECLIVIPQQSGPPARFLQSAYKEAFLHESDRSRAHFFGKETPPVHPMVEALKQTKNLEEAMLEHGTMLGRFVGEDAIIRGERERPGPPVFGEG